MYPNCHLDLYKDDSCHPSSFLASQLFSYFPSPPSELGSRLLCCFLDSEKIFLSQDMSARTGGAIFSYFSPLFSLILPRKKRWYIYFNIPSFPSAGKVFSISDNFLSLFHAILLSFLFFPPFHFPLSGEGDGLGTPGPSRGNSRKAGETGNVILNWEGTTESWLSFKQCGICIPSLPAFENKH